MYPKWTISFRGRKKKSRGLQWINEAKSLCLQLDGKCKHPELWYHPLPWRAVRTPATRLPEAQATTGCENQTSGTGEARERAGKGMDQLSSNAQPPPLQEKRHLN